MIENSEAARILERLVGQWPGMAATDAATDDWMRAIRKAGHPYETADLLVSGWTKDRGPRVADWFETARQVAHRKAVEAETEARREIEAVAGDLLGHDRVRALIADARRRLTDAQRKRPADRPMPVSKYDHQPVSWGERRMTPEEREAELRAIGDRKIRERRP